MAHVFISYAREDQAFVRRLHDGLNESKRDAWVDWEGIRPSEEWITRIYSAMDEAIAVVFVLSPASAASAVCAQELAHAIAQHKRLIPIVCVDTDPDTAPEPLRRLNWIFARPGDDVAKAFATLLHAIDTDLVWVNAHTALLVKAREWEAKARDNGLLLRGRELTAAETWLGSAAAHPTLAPTALHGEYILASRKAATRRQRVVAIAGGATLLILGVVSGAAYRANERANLEAKAADAAKLVAEEQKKVAALNIDLADKARVAQVAAEKAARLEAERKQEQEALRLVAEANRLIYRQPDQALMLAYQGQQTAPTAAARQIATSVVDTALNIMRMRRDIQKREFTQWGSGESYIAPTWFQGKLSARLSPDGTRVIMTSERGSSGPKPPGDAYVLNNETLKLVKLEPPSRDGRPIRRLEYTGFSTSGKKIYLSRQYNIEVYSVDGAFEQQYIEGGVGTKFPIQVIDGVEDDRTIVYGDGDGSLVAYDTEKKRVQNLSRKSGAPVTELKVSPSGKWLVAVRKNGRAQLWRVGDFKSPNLPDLPPEGILTAAFKRSVQENVLVLAGTEGRVQTWSLSGARPQMSREFTHGHTPVAYASFLADGERILTVGDDLTSRIWQTSTGRPAGNIESATPVDWAAVRRSGKTVFRFPYASRVETEGLDLADPSLAVREIRQAGGHTWLLTWAKDPATTTFRYGPAYRVEGGKAVPFPSRDGRVTDVIGDDRQAWLLTYPDAGPGSAYRSVGDQLHRFPNDEISVSSVFLDGQDAWLATPQGAFRVHDQQVVRYTGDNVIVRFIKRMDSRIWIGTDDGAFRIDDDAAFQVTGVAAPVREVLHAGGKAWVRTGPWGSSDTPSGPALRIDGYQSVAFPDDQTRVEVVKEIEGKVWLGTGKGPHFVDGKRAVPVEGCPYNITAVEPHFGEIWFLGAQGFFRGPACRIERGKAVQIPAKGAVRALLEAGGALWLLPDTYPPTPLLRMQKNAAQEIAVAGDATVIDVVEAGGKTWLLTRVNSDPGPALVVDGARAIPASDLTGRVSAIRQIGGTVWLLTSSGPLRADPAGVSRVLGDGSAALDVFELDGKTWLVTVRGAYRLDRSGWKQITPAGLSVRQALVARGKMWLLTNRPDGKQGPVYLVNDDGVEPLPCAEAEVRAIREVGGQLWALTGSDDAPGPACPLIP